MKPSVVKACSSSFKRLKGLLTKRSNSQQQQPENTIKCGDRAIPIYAALYDYDAQTCKELTFRKGILCM